MVEWHDIPYYHVPVDPKDKEPAFAEVSRLVGHHQADVVVLARYMQILPPQLCREYAHQVINIHHSFLPSFVGAKPYHQASLRGVKLIGATCHYVTEELDAGPIIEQDVVRVSHRGLSARCAATHYQCAASRYVAGRSRLCFTGALGSG